MDNVDGGVFDSDDNIPSSSLSPPDTLTQDIQGSTLPLYQLDVVDKAMRLQSWLPVKNEIV